MKKTMKIFVVIAATLLMAITAKAQETAGEKYMDKFARWMWSSDEDYSNLASCYLYLATKEDNVKALEMSGLMLFLFSDEDRSTEAVGYFERASEKGSVFAMKRLAECYELGSGVEKDLDKAEDWRKKAEAADSLNTDEDMDAICEEEEEIVVDLADEYLQVALALIDYNDESDNGLIDECLERAAELDCSDAMAIYGSRLLENENPELNAKALDYLLQAAQQGNISAMFKLAEAYESGIGVTKDHEKAQYWEDMALGYFKKTFELENIYPFLTAPHIMYYF